MARIPTAELEQIKTTVSLSRLVEAAGVKLTKHGADLIGHCPFHDDKTPSLVVSPAKNLWHCLGACQQGGSVIDWVMQKEKVSFRHAVELLRAEHLPLVADVKPALTPLVEEHADDQAALQQVVDYYHATLKQSPEALEYLAKRGLNHPEIIERFKLGYANRTLGYRLPEKQSKAGAAIRGRLQALGILRDSGHEHFSGSVVIPVIDENHQVKEMYGRKILGARLRKGTPIHTYLPGPHQGVFNIAALKQYQDIILCESLIDALTFYAAGLYNVTTSYGVCGFTDELLNAFKIHGTKNIYIAYDSDEAGNIAAERLAKTLIAEGLSCFRVRFPKGMDANDYANHVKPADKALSLVVRKAEWLGQGEQQEVSEIIEVNEIAAPSINKLPIEPAPALAAPPSASNLAFQVQDNELTLNLDNRFYRIRGLERNTNVEQLKINLLVKHHEHFHVDHVDLYSARHRATFIKQAAIELSLKEEVLKKDLGQLLLLLEAEQDKQINQVKSVTENLPKLSEDELKAALSFLTTPDLIERIKADFTALGLVGETTNKLVAYLAAVSRKLDKPLAIMVQSSSAAGKSSLMEAVLQLMPAEERVQYSAMTGQALFYMGETDLKHKILSIAEEAGATQSAYALKLLQSEGEVSIASTGKNATTGNLETQVYRVEGPVMLFSTTTAIDIDEELMNRCLILSVDESRAQTKAIHEAQRQKRTLMGLRAKQQKESIIALHQNAQRLLRPLAVLNPYADYLTFLDAKTRTRRDHEKYLSLIDAIALLHQYQRPLKQDKYQGQVIEYMEVTLDDIALANELAHEVLGKSLDELPPQTRRLLELITEMVKQSNMNPRDYRFSRKEIRAFTGWSDGQLKIHCHRLEELEYLINHGGKRGKQINYELLYDGSTQENTPHLMGLLDVTRLKQAYDDQKSGQKEKKSVPSQGQVSPKLGGSQDDKNEVLHYKNKGEMTLSLKTDENALLRKKQNGLASHHNPV